MPTPKISAKLFRLFLPLLILSIFFLNLAANKDAFDKTKIDVLDNPQDKNAHRSLGKILFEHNQLSLAAIEFRLANDTAGLKEIDDLTSQPQKITAQISFWQHLIEKFPTYRDAYIKLAILNQKVGQNSEAKLNAEKALEIDPNNEVARSLLSLL